MYLVVQPLRNQSQLYLLYGALVLIDIVFCWLFLLFIGVPPPKHRQLQKFNFSLTYYPKWPEEKVMLYPHFFSWPNLLLLLALIPLLCSVKCLHEIKKGVSGKKYMGDQLLLLVVKVSDLVFLGIFDWY